MKDREIEERLRYNAAFQLFCGRYLVDHWRIPDHTAVCKFRCRLSPETQRSLLVLVVKAAEKAGFADPSWMDLDSTAQEANITYPADASLMLKLAKDSARIAGWLREHCRSVLPMGLQHDMKAIGAKAKEYLFLTKNTAMEKKREVFRQLHNIVKSDTYQLIDVLSQISGKKLKLMPSNLRVLSDRILQKGKRYL